MSSPSEWSKALLLEKWMTNAVQCCEEAGIAPPASALQLVAPTPPLLTPSPPTSVITPPPPPHIPEVAEDNEGGRDVKNLVNIILCYCYSVLGAQSRRGQCLEQGDEKNTGLVVTQP